MTLIVILITLGLSHIAGLRYLRDPAGLYRAYFRKVLSFLHDTRWHNTLGVLAIMFPPLLIIAIAQLSLAGVYYGLLGFALSIAVLLFCLGPANLELFIAHYLLAHNNKDLEKRRYYAQEILGEPPPDDERD